MAKKQADFGLLIEFHGLYFIVAKPGLENTRAETYLTRPTS
jgi:hypothetical protein